jgi:purine-binding chemotaxis protein CheW
VVQQGTQQVGILIDEVPEIRTIQSDAMVTEPTHTVAERRPFLSGLLNIENRLSGMMEVSRVLASVENEAVQQAGSL